MLYKLTPYTIAQLLTGVVSVAVAFFVWKRRASRGGWPLFFLFVAIAEWALSNGLEAAAVTQELKIFWSKIAYLGAQTSPVLLVLFALQFSGRGKRITPLTSALLFIVPTITIFLAATNEAHGLVWVGFSPGPEGTNSLIYHHGPAFWIAIAYIFIMVSVGTALLILSAVRSQKVYREQSRFLLVASILPWIGFLIYIMNINPFPGLDTVSISFFFSGLVLACGMFKGRLMDIVPIAHELIVENIKNGILIVDDHLRMIDFNSAAASQLSINRSKIIGAQVQSLGIFWEKVKNQFDKNLAKRIEISTDDSDQTYMDVRVTPLNDHRKRFLGWAVIMDDISVRRKVETDLQMVNNHLKRQLGEIQELQEQLRDQAMRDSITGVYNRRYLEETLSREVAHAQRKGYSLSIIMLDVDFFKKVNDTYGHKMGDDIVIALGRLLQAQTRESDCVSRYGGDEFVLVMPEMSKEHAFERAELWRSAVKAMVFQIGEKVVNVTVSLGISTFPANGPDSDALLKAADEALYLAKDSGRDRTYAAK
jgi:diguanylate cyclase (GGDEF)-like protein/PAS domain S-box-containing protein